MKNRIQHLLTALVLLAFATLNSPLSTAFAQGTAFTYQGRVFDGGNPASGTYNLTFTLFNTNTTGVPIAVPVTNNAVVITNGLFTVIIDFGAPVWNGQTNWLQIGVATNGVTSFTPLLPRQQVTPTPYAIFATTANNVSGTVMATQLVGTLLPAQLPSLVVTNNDTAVTFSNVTISGILSLPAPATIDSGGNSLLSSPGDNNFYAGPGAGSSTTSGAANTGIGAESLQNNTNGTNNTAIGTQTLENNTNGAYNTASGERALADNTSGNDNTADGRHALLNNLDGSGNTAVGYQALSANTSGSNNIALGLNAGLNLTTGYANIDIGNAGLATDTSIIRIGTGQTNTFIAGVINGDGGGLTDLDEFQLSSFQGNYDTVGGGLDNLITSGTRLATIGGGNNNTNSGNAGTIAGGQNNTVTNGEQPTVGGGYGNTAGSNYTTVAGGYENIANNEEATVAGGHINQAIGSCAFVGGGDDNIASGTDATAAGGGGNRSSGEYAFVGSGLFNSAISEGSVVGGGFSNYAQGGNYATVAGGDQNNADNDSATVGGGFANNATGNCSTVPGGYQNTAGGAYSFAGGVAAQATNGESFVWSDGSATTSSTADSQFMVRASGGTIIYSSSGNSSGVSLAAGGGSWNNLCDRNAKEHFIPVTSRDLLTKLSALPISKWSYKTERGVTHIGPMAQDFYAAFGVGEDDRHISTVDEEGVALAAVQGLNQKLNEKDAEIQELKARLDKLEQMMAEKSGGPK